MGTTIRELRAEFTANTAKLRTGASEASGLIRNFGRTVSNTVDTFAKTGLAIYSWGQNIKSAVMGAEAIIKGLVLETADLGRNLKETALTLGLDMRQIQGLRALAVESDTTLEGAASTLIRLQRTATQAYDTMAKAAKEGKTIVESETDAVDEMGDSLAGAAGIFQHLHFTMQELASFKGNPAGLFAEVARRLQEVNNATERNAYSMGLFGRAFAQQAPLIRAMASGGLATGIAEAMKAGAFRSEEDLKRMEAAHESLEKLKLSWLGFKETIGAGIMGGAIDLIDELREGLQGSKGLAQEIAATLNASLKSLAAWWKENGAEMIRNAKEIGQELLEGFKAILPTLEALLAPLRALGIESQTERLQVENIKGAAQLNPYEKKWAEQFSTKGKFYSVWDPQNARDALRDYATMTNLLKPGQVTWEGVTAMEPGLTNRELTSPPWKPGDNPNVRGMFVDKSTINMVFTQRITAAQMQEILSEVRRKTGKKTMGTWEGEPFGRRFYGAQDPLGASGEWATP